MVFQTTAKGIWWLPNNPERQLVGELSISTNDGIYLELYGTFDDNELGRLIKGKGNYKPMILGTTSDGKKITLSECYILNSISNTQGFPIFKYQASDLFMGVHFSQEEEIGFSRIYVNYFCLEEWLDKKPFQIEWNSGNSENPIKKEYIISSAPIEPISVEVNDYEISIHFKYSVTHSLVEAKLIHTAWIVFSFKEEMPFDECKGLVNKIKNFLSLVMGVSTYSVEFEGRTRFNKQIGANGREIYPLVKIHYKIPEWVTETRKVHSVNMPLAFNMVEENLQTLLTNWINKADILSPVYNLFFATRFNPHLYLEGAFLNYIQALETYHRRKVDGKFQSDDEYLNNLYQRFKEVIPNDIDKDFKQSLVQGKLRFANEYSLRKRLKGLLIEIGAKIPIGFLGEDKRIKSFVDEVCDTRNYLTHYSPELEEKAANGQRLHKLTEQLTCIVEMCLFYELGLSWEEIRRIIETNKSYKNIFN